MQKRSIFINILLYVHRYKHLRKSIPDLAVICPSHDLNTTIAHGIPSAQKITVSKWFADRYYP